MKLAGLEGTSIQIMVFHPDAFDIIKEWHKRKKAQLYPTTATWASNTGVMELTTRLHSPSWRQN